MAGYSVTVCLPPQAAAALTDALANALAPFGELSDLDWEVGFLWDTWRVSGGHDGYGFWIAPGHEDDLRLIHDGPRRDGTIELSLPGRCAGGPRELLDLTERPALGEALAIEAWELWQRLSQHHPPALPRQLIMRRLEPNPHRYVDLDLVNAEYEAQPLVQAYRAAHPLGGRDPGRYSAQIQFHLDSLTYFGYTAQTFADRVISRHRGGWDLLTVDGWWIQDNGAAHHAPCGSPCTHTPEAFNEARGNASIPEGMHRYLDALPTETLMVKVSGHC